VLRRVFAKRLKAYSSLGYQLDNAESRHVGERDGLANPGEQRSLTVRG
jgi:hypothetical protein